LHGLSPCDEDPSIPHAGTYLGEGERLPSVSLLAFGSHAALVGIGDSRMPKTRALFTSTPETPAPDLVCPECDRRLLYRQTVLNGVNPRERWDYFECPRCGLFEYRQRTRKLRPIAIAPFPPKPDQL
jgi:hypothetical protein